MNKEKFLKAVMKLPKIETNNPITAMNSISVEDLMNAVDRFDKVPTYNELLRENKKQKEVISKAIEYINSNPNVFYDESLIDVETLKNNEMTDEVIGDIRFISNLLNILHDKEVSE